MAGSYIALFLCVVGGACAVSLPNAAGVPHTIWSLIGSVGNGLRSLSLSGSAGNALAWCLYVLLSLAPLLSLCPRGRRRGWADALIVIASAYSFFAWYAIANPTLFLPSGFGQEAVQVLQALYFCVLLGLLMGALALRMADDRSDMPSLFRRLRIIILSIVLCKSFLTGAECATILRSANTAETAAPVFPYAAVEGSASAWVIAGGRCVCAVALGTAFVMTLMAARELLGGMRSGWFAQGNEALANRLCKTAKVLLGVTVAASLANNAIALYSLYTTGNASVIASFPLAEAFSACALIALSRFIREGARMRRENESFV